MRVFSLPIVRHILRDAIVTTQRFPYDISCIPSTCRTNIFYITSRVKRTIKRPDAYLTCASAIVPHLRWQTRNAFTRYIVYTRIMFLVVKKLKIQLKKKKKKQTALKFRFAITSKTTVGNRLANEASLDCTGSD